MTCYREEIFGPVLICLTAPTLDAAIDLVNANEYGNGTALFTRSGSAAERFRRRINVGQVGINMPIPVYSRVSEWWCLDDNADQLCQVPLPMFSFTGNKRSVAGGGASTFYGRPGLDFFTQTKTVTSLWRGDDVAEAEGRGVNMPTQS